MSRYIVLFLFLWIPTFQEAASVHSDQDHIIPWADTYRLTWDDFQAKPDKRHFAAALSDISFEIDVRTENRELVVFVQTAFNRDKSWVKEEGRNDYLLKHEQTHFDLYEVNARKLRKEIQNSRLTVSNVQSTINRLIDKYNDLNEELQARYDEETDHSLKEKNQEIWNNRVEDDLVELSAYAETTFRIAVKER